jgi:hypothetical protein
MPMSDSPVAASAKTTFPLRSAAAPWLRLSLSAFVSKTSSLTTPLVIARRYVTKQLKVEFCKAKSGIDHQDDAGQAAPQLQVVGHHLLPAQLGTALDRCVTVSRQIRQQRVGLVPRAHLEQIDVLCSPWRPGGESQPILLGQPVDGGRLPALDRPTNAISGRSVTGNWSSWLAVVRNLAVCAQASARCSSLASGLPRADRPGAGDFGSSIKRPNPSL